MVDHDRQRSDRHDFQTLDLKVDGHGLFQQRIGPAAGAEAVGAAEHHQPAPHVLRVADQHFDLRVGELLARHVGQQHRVKGLQLGQVAEQLLRPAGADGDFDVHGSQPLDQVIELAQVFVVFDQQHLAAAAHVREGGGQVVLRQGVVRRHRPG